MEDGMELWRPWHALTFPLPTRHMLPVCVDVSPKHIFMKKIVGKDDMTMVVCEPSAYHSYAILHHRNHMTCFCLHKTCLSCALYAMHMPAAAK